MNYAMVDKSNVVFNIAVWDGQTEWNPGCKVYLIRETDQCAIGYVLAQTEVGYTFLAPAAPEEETVNE